MKSLSRYAIERPLLLALAMVVALALLPVAVWLDLRDLSANGRRIPSSPACAVTA